MCSLFVDRRILIFLTMAYRKEKLESLMEELLSEEILRNNQNEGALITITKVIVNKTLEEALVHVSVLPDDQKKEAVRTLNQQAGKFAYELLKKMQIKKVPHITFT